jgi:integrase/recombinase XerD
MCWVRGEYMGCSELIEAFLAAKQDTFAPHTLRTYRYELSTFARLRPDILIHDITEPQLRLFLDATADLKPNTLARRMATLHSCFDWAYRQGLLPADPTTKLKAMPISVRIPHPLTEKQVEAILDVIPRQDLRNRLLLTLLYETGMRIGEALQLHTQQVHLDNQDGGYIQIVNKVNKERVIPLIDASRSVVLLQEVLKTLDEGDSLFPGDVSKRGRHGEAINYTTIRHHFERYVDQARSTCPELFIDEKEPITINRLRHTFATIKLRDGISLSSVSMLLGHSSTQTTQYYTRIDLETVKRELEEARQRKLQREKLP